MSAAVQARLEAVTLPDFGMPAAMPELPPALYAARLARLRERADARGYDRLVVYADREHSANLSYLTGFDPRFEEALLVVGPDGDPAVLVGNECYGMAGAAPLPMRRHRFQDFSLPGQPRDRSRAARRDPRRGGHRRRQPGRRRSGGRRTPTPGMSDLPAYLVDEMRAMVGATGSVENATDLFIDAADGLRVINEVEQLAAFEWASCQTSQGVRQLLHGLRPGMTEREAVALLGWNGWPLSCHLMLTAGPRATFGLLSPGDRPIERGDPFTTAFGIWGALTCRAGLRGRVRCRAARARSATTSIGSWRRTSRRSPSGTARIRIGVTGGALHGDHRPATSATRSSASSSTRGTSSTSTSGSTRRSAPGSTIELRSGMALQVDVIPATGTEYFTTNIEDGIALADDALRDELARRYPDLWSRVERAAGLHGGLARHRAAPRRPPALEHAGVPASVPAAAGPRDVDRRMTGLREVVLRSEEMEVVILPDVGGTDPPDPSVRPGHPANTRRSGRTRRRTVPLGCLRHVAVVQSSGAGDDACSRAERSPWRANFPDGTAIHGLVSSARWFQRSNGDLAFVGGGGGWPWAFEVSQTASLSGTTLTLEYRVRNLDDAPMPAGIGLHPWFRRPVEVRLPAEAVYSTNVDSPPHSARVTGTRDLRSLAPPAEGLDDTWTQLTEPRVELVWPESGIQATLEAETDARASSSQWPVLPPSTRSPWNRRRMARIRSGGSPMASPIRSALLPPDAIDAAGPSPDGPAPRRAGVVIPGPLELVLTAILFGAIGAFSPTRLALSVVMLTSETAPWGRAIAYLIGSTAIFATAAIIGLLGVEAAGLRGVDPRVNIVVGTIMIGAAISMVIGQRRRKNLPPQPSSHPVLAAAGIGAGVAFQSFGRLLVLVAGGYRIGALTRGPATGLALVGLMILIWQAPVWSPMLLYVVRRKRFDALARRVQPAIDKIEDGAAGAILVALVGAWILFEGLTA